MPKKSVKKKRTAARAPKRRPTRRARRSPAPKAAPRKRKAAGRRPAAAKAPSRRAPKRVVKAKATAKAKVKTGKSKPRLPVRRRKGAAGFDVEAPLDPRGLGAEAGGQSGDTEGLSRAEMADSESVEELIEEGQAFEAGIVSGVENAPDADEGEIRTREVPEDDVPQEYLDED